MAETNGPSLSINPDSGVATIKNHPITYLNFEGRASDYNALGSRNFHSVLTEEDAEILLANRYNVKQHDPTADAEELTPWWSLQVKVQFGAFKPPLIVMITGEEKLQKVLNNDNISVLDAVDLARVDLTIRPYDHNRPGMGTGRAAYLKSGFFTLDEDELMRDYGFNPAGSAPPAGATGDEPF